MRTLAGGQAGTPPASHAATISNHPSTTSAMPPPPTLPQGGAAPLLLITPLAGQLCNPLNASKPHFLHLATILILSLLLSHLVFSLLFDAVSLIMLLPCPGSPCPRYPVPDSQFMKQCCYVGVGGIKTASADLVATPQAGAPGMLLQVSLYSLSPPAPLGWVFRICSPFFFMCSQGHLDLT